MFPGSFREETEVETVITARIPLTRRGLHRMSQHDPQPQPDPRPAQPGESRSGLAWRLWGKRWLRLVAVAALLLLAVAPVIVSWAVYRSGWAGWAGST